MGEWYSKNSSLNLAGSSVARDENGLKTANQLVNEYLQSILNAVAHYDKKYDEFRQTVYNNWNGVDADNYIKSIETVRNDLWYMIRDQIKSKFNDSDGVLKQDLNEFKRDQSNVSF